jgi:hypothetical protein
MMKNDATVSEKKCAPEAMRDSEITAPNAPAATNHAGRRRSAITSASAKNPPAASPEENEQLVRHWFVITNAGENRLVPPNSATSRGRARPKWFLRPAFTTSPAPMISTSSR